MPDFESLAKPKDFLIKWVANSDRSTGFNEMERQFLKFWGLRGHDTWRTTVYDITTI